MIRTVKGSTTTSFCYSIDSPSSLCNLVVSPHPRVPRPHVPASRVPASPRPRVSASSRIRVPAFARPRVPRPGVPRPRPTFSDSRRRVYRTFLELQLTHKKRRSNLNFNLSASFLCQLIIFIRVETNLPKLQGS